MAPPEADDPAAAVAWAVAPWPLEEALRELTGAPGPAGLRLPLEHLPEDVPRQVLTLEVDPEGWELFLPPWSGNPCACFCRRWPTASARWRRPG